MIAVIDYGAGNLRSISRALQSHGQETEITSDPARILAADRVVLPGVGNAKAAMKQLESSGIAQAVRDVAERGTPLLGICLGMQLLFGEQEEGPTFGLDILPGRVARLPQGLKVPHMGWNQVAFRGQLDGQAEDAFYFVHSFVAVPTDAADTAGATEYGISFPAVVAREHVWGTQFHPEKSGPAGLALIGRWLDA